MTVAAAILILLVSLVVASTWVTNQQLRQLLINQGLQTTDSLAERSVLALLYHSPENVEASVQTALSLKGVASVGIYTEDGGSLYTSGEPEAPDQIDIALVQKLEHSYIYKEDSQFWYYIAPVRIKTSKDSLDAILFDQEVDEGHKNLGYVYVIGSKTSLDTIQTGIMVSNLMITLLIGLLLLFAIQFSIRRLVLPLERMTNVMKKAERGDYVPEIDIQGPIEIHHIGGAYNRMISALSERDRTLREQNVKLEKQAIHDHLTGLLNRNGFEQALVEAIRECNEDNAEHAFCYMDLDKFKAVNDNCGHNAGDLLLQNVCKILSRHIRKDFDVLARVGGDEFTLILKNCPLDKAEKIGSAICKDVDQYRFMWGDRFFSIGVSIGIVPLKAPLPDIQDVLKVADSACYHAKEEGRGRVHLIQPGETKISPMSDGIEIIKRIDECLEHDLFDLFCQPANITGEKTVVSEEICEILLRIPCLDDSKYMMPGNFMPLAERYDRQIDIDRWVISRTFSLLQEHTRLFSRFDVFCINLSTASLLDESIISFIEAQLAIYEIKASSICFDVEETDMINNLHMASQFFESVKKSGCRIAIDDYTANTVSTSNLQNLEIDYLKIDPAIIHDLSDNIVTPYIIRSINEIAHLMGMKTVAKHVDKIEIVDELAALGVDYVQGHCLQQPVALLTLDNPGDENAITG